MDGPNQRRSPSFRVAVLSQKHPLPNVLPGQRLPVMNVGRTHAVPRGDLAILGVKGVDGAQDPRQRFLVAVGEPGATRLFSSSASWGSPARTM